MDRVPWELVEITGTAFIYTRLNNKCPLLYGLNGYMHEISLAIKGSKNRETGFT